MTDAFPQPTTAKQREALAAYLRADAARLMAITNVLAVGRQWIDPKGSVTLNEMKAAIKSALTCQEQAAVRRGDYFKAMGVET